MNLPAAFDQLGITRGRKRWGPCPACGESGGRGRRPLRVTKDVWWCAHCHQGGGWPDAVGFHLGLGKPSPGDRLAWRRIYSFMGGAQPVQWEEQEVTPERVDVRPALRTSTPLASVQDPTVASFLSLRRIPSSAPAGVLGGGFWCDPWWPRGWSRRWPLVVPAFNSRGELMSMHARAVDPGVEPKSMWPRGASAGGLLFLDPQHTRPWLQGRGPEPDIILITEGLTDYLTAATYAPTIGIEAGSHSALRLIEFSPTQRIFMATHQDTAGFEYERKVVDACYPAEVRRLPLRRACSVGAG